MRLFWKQAGVSIASALVVAVAFLWLHRAPVPPPPGSCLDRVISEIEIDLSTLESAMASMQKATGLRFEIDRSEIRPGFNDAFEKCLRLRNVTVNQAMQCIVMQFSERWDWCAKGDVVRLGSRPSKDGPRIVRAYDVRDLLVVGRQFADEFERLTGLPAESPSSSGATVKTGYTGSFSSVPKWPVTWKVTAPVVAGEASSIRYIIQHDFDYEDGGYDAGGWIILHGTAAQHEQARKMLLFLRSMR